MFSFFKKKPPAPPAAATPEPAAAAAVPEPAVVAAVPSAAGEATSEATADRQGWMARLRQGLRKTGSGITQVFTGAKIGDEQYEALESALLMADAGLAATAQLLRELKARVKAEGRNDPASVRRLLEDVLADLLTPLERPLEVGRADCTVMMVVGVNGAGKTTSIGKLARHLATARQKVLLAAADTFRAAAREQLAVWAQRVDERGAASPSGAPPLVEIVAQQGGDPAAVTYDAVVAGRARGCDVVIADTAGRLTTQAHLMEELKKIKRVIAKADPQAPHEVLLVVDGNTGQNALAQVKAFDEALGLTGLIVTKLDGTAKGGVLAAIALWARELRASSTDRPPLAVYFLGVGEKLEDLQTFSAREFAQALLGN